ncbi:hypothetical protein ACEQPO_02935 [Bacillus sp. SL00103]
MFKKPFQFGISETNETAFDIVTDHDGRSSRVPADSNKNQRQTCPFWEHFSHRFLQETIASTSGGSLWMMLMVSFVLLTIWSIVAMKKRGFHWVWLFPLLLFAVLLWLKAQIGHPAATDNKILTTSLDFIHLVSASIWVGGLTAIALLLKKSQMKISRSSGIR